MLFSAHKHGLEGACLLDRYSYNDEMYQRCFDIYRAPRVLTPECARVCQSRFMTKCGPGYSLFDAINQWALKTPPMLFTVGFSFTSKQRKSLPIDYCLTYCSIVPETTISSLFRFPAVLIISPHRQNYCTTQFWRRLLKDQQMKLSSTCLTVSSEEIISSGPLRTNWDG